MTQKVVISPKTVHVAFSDEPAHHVEIYEIVADFDLEGDPVGFEAFDFKSPPFGDVNRLETSQLKASFVPEENALSVWFKRDPRPSDQQVINAELGFSIKRLLVFVKYSYERGEAARKHKEAQR